MNLDGEYMQYNNVVNHLVTMKYKQLTKMNITNQVAGGYGIWDYGKHCCENMAPQLQGLSYSEIWQLYKLYFLMTP